jgi:hypothetical protein
MDLDWSGDGYHKLNVTFAYTYWQNNSIQALGMQFVDAGLAAVSNIINGVSAEPTQFGINPPDQTASFNTEALRERTTNLI